jgi:hypothetical protein
MPKVGMKSFSYDEAGVKKANEEAMKTGLPIEYEDRNYSQYGNQQTYFKKGGMVRGGRKATRGLQYKACE